MKLYPCTKNPPCPNNRRHHTPICPKTTASSTKSISAVDLKASALKNAVEQDDGVMNTTVSLLEKPTTFADFILATRCVSEYSRLNGLKDSTFKNRPRLVGSTRTLQVFSDDTAIVSVLINGRSKKDVLDDLAEGVGKRNALSDSQIKKLKLAIVEDFMAIYPPQSK